MVALLTAACLLAARLLRLGFLADFLSQTVLVGFLTGVGFQVSIAMLGEMLGVSVDSRRDHRAARRGRAWVAAGPYADVLCLSTAVVALVLVLRGLVPRLPGPLFAVAGAIVASATFDFAGHGISLFRPTGFRSRARTKSSSAGVLAAQIYKAFPPWSSVCSAIVCWALIAAE